MTNATATLDARASGECGRTIRAGLLATALLFVLACSVRAADLSDSLPAPETIEDVFAADQTNQYVLEVEAAMARAQAIHGAIPNSAAEEITRKAHTRFAPRNEIAEERKVVQHRMVALLNVWRRQLDVDARQYVHYGATTVDIYDTALALQLLRSTLLLVQDLREIEAILIRLARENADAVMPGRTLGQHALPITFGKKVSTWIGENRRSIERLKSLRGELARCAILKGAVGTYAGLGERAMEIEQTFAKELGLPPPYPDDWHGTRDVFASYALTLALISKVFGHIGQELFLLQMTDIGETDEPRDPTSISSSSMAQKINPSKSEALIQAGRVIPRLAEVVLDDVVNFFERDNTSGPTSVIEDISVKTEANLKTARKLLDELQLNRAAMRENLAKTKGLIMAQRVVFALSARLGKEEADKRVHEIIQRAFEAKTDFRAALLGDATISGIFSASDLDSLLEPGGYVGLVREEIKSVIEHAEALRETDPIE